MKKYEIYLPLKYNDGREIEAEKIKQIREKLIAVFRSTQPSVRNRLRIKVLGNTAAWISSTILSR